jgi:hypothetical protein
MLNVQQGDLQPDGADYVFFSEQVNLPPSPKLGVMLVEKEAGPTIDGFAHNSGSKAAGIAPLPPPFQLILSIIK